MRRERPIVTLEAGVDGGGDLSIIDRPRESRHSADESLHRYHPPMAVNETLTGIEGNANTVSMLNACAIQRDDMERDAAQKISTILSGLWVMKQLAPKTFVLRGEGIVHDLLEKYLELRPGTTGMFSGVDTSDCDNEYSSHDKFPFLDMWYFTELKGGFGPPALRPNQAWVSCALRLARAPHLHTRIIAGNMSDDAIVEYYIFAMELTEAMRESEKAVRTNASTEASPVLVPSGKNSSEEVASIYFDMQRLHNITDFRYIRRRDVCENNPRECGYYLTHRLMQLTRLFSTDVREKDKPLVREIGRALRRHTIPHLQAQRQPLDFDDVDLAGEVLLVLKHIVLAAGDANDGPSLAALRQVADMVRRSSAPDGDCHSAVVYFLADSVQM